MLFRSYLQQAGAFALNVLGKGQQDIAFLFFKETEWDDQTINGQPYRASEIGAPLLLSAAAWLEGRIVDAVEHGDHTVFVAEVVDAHVNAAFDGRPDEQTLVLSDLGENIYYGG